MSTVRYGLALYVVFALWLLILSLIVRLEEGELAQAVLLSSRLCRRDNVPIQHGTTSRSAHSATEQRGSLSKTWGQPGSSSPHLQGNVATTSHGVIPGTLQAGERGLGQNGIQQGQTDPSACPLAYGWHARHAAVLDRSAFIFRRQGACISLFTRGRPVLFQRTHEPDSPFEPSAKLGSLRSAGSSSASPPR